MGKKYEPVPDEKRRLLISLIYEKGLNISKASQEAGIYYPTAKAINKVYLRQNGRICKKTNRDRTKKNNNVKKVQTAEQKTQQMKSELKASEAMNKMLHLNFMTAPTTCANSENNFSQQVAPMKEQSYANTYDDMTVDETPTARSSAKNNNFMSAACSYHTPEAQDQLTSIMKLLARIKASSCNSCIDKVSSYQLPKQEVQVNQIERQQSLHTPHFASSSSGLSEEVKNVEIQSAEEADRPTFQFHQYSKHTIIRPVPVFPTSYMQQGNKLDELLNDPALKRYRLPMKGCMKEASTTDESD